MKNKNKNNKTKHFFENLFFCFPFFSGVLCWQKNNFAFCQALPNGQLKLTTFRKKCWSWHTNIFLLRGIEFVLFAVWAYVCGIKVAEQGARASLKNIQIVKIKTLDILLKIFFVLVAICGLFLFSWLWFGLLPSSVGFWIFGENHSLFFQNFSNAICKVLALFLLFFLLGQIPKIKLLWRLGTAGNLAVCGKKICALNFWNIFFGACALSFFVLSLIGLSVSFAIMVLLNCAVLLLSFGIVFEACCLQERCNGGYQKLCIITGFLFVQLPSKTEVQLASGARVECELMKRNENRECVTAVGEVGGEVAMAFALAQAQSALKNAGFKDNAEAEWLVANVLGCKRFDLLTIKSLTAGEYRVLLSALERRLSGEPQDKIFGFKEFFGLRLKVNKNVLSPRPETELLVEQVLKNGLTQKQKVLDLCTGSGAIAIALAANCNAEVWASDISEDALVVAKQNAQNCAVKINFRPSNMFAALKHKKFDVIVSNPPYIKTADIALLENEVKNFDPLLALDGGADGLDFYREIAQTAHNFLVTHGKLFLEIGALQASKVKKLLTPHYDTIKIIKDYGGHARIVVATKKD